MGILQSVQRWMGKVNPRVMRVVMNAIALPGKVKTELDARTVQIAKSLGLATKEEVEALQNTIRSLEGSISELDGQRTLK